MNTILIIVKNLQVNSLNNTQQVKYCKIKLNTGKLIRFRLNHMNQRI